jgi:hypothetical protein
MSSAALALKSINESVYDWNVETDEVYFSPSLRAMLGSSLTSRLRAKAGRPHSSGRPAVTSPTAARLFGARRSALKPNSVTAPPPGWRWARQHEHRRA